MNDARAPLHGLQITLEELRAQLPRPILPARPGWERLYWRAWELAARAVQRGTPANGFALLYFDAALSGNLVQWDTCAAAAFARYGDELLPVLPALDAFYRRQEADGYIACAYRGANGAALWHKASADAVNPPLFAWAEWLLFQVHGRVERLIAVWASLTRYYRWLSLNRTLPNGLYWSSTLGSGMASAPRSGAAWVDLSLQQALNALSLACIAQALGDEPEAAAFQAEHARLAALINGLMWDEQSGLYQNLDANGSLLPSTTLAPYWALLAEVAPPERAARMTAHLASPAAFWRAHPFPTQAAAEPQPRNNEPGVQGSVWAATTYMVISGLQAAGYPTLAWQATARHLDALLAVYEATGTLWESYQADVMAPGAAARPDLVGGSGLGPIALLIEQVIGVELDAEQHEARWHLHEQGPHGIENLPFAGDRLRLWFDGVDTLSIDCRQALRLRLSGRLRGEIVIPAGGMTINACMVS